MSLLKSGAFAALLALAPCAPALALSYQMMSDQALLDDAQGAALFEVVAVAPAAPGATETRYLLAWQRGFAGRPAFAYEWLALPGAVSDKHELVVDGIPLLSPGERWLVFYARRADGVLQPVHLTLGLFRRIDEAGGGAAYLRTVDVDAAAAKHAHARYAAPRDAAAFERWLVARDRQLVAEDDAHYLREQPLAMPKYTFMMFSFSPPRPARWFEFDAGGTVPVFAGAVAQAGTTFNVYSALQTAIAAWNNDAGSRIALQYAGVGSSNADVAINVKWNDPDNQIAGSFDCSRGGVLGIGGSSANTSRSARLGGLDWARRIRGFVVIQDGAGCWMNGANGANGAELLAHELGHVLALSHSCGDAASGACDTTTKNQALMRASAHGNGRGAVLGADDRAGIAVPYPAPNAPPPRPVRVMKTGFEAGGG